MSGIRSIHRNPTIKGYATAASAPIFVDSDDNLLKYNPFGSGTVTSEVALGGAETLVTTEVLVASDAGKTLFLALAAGFQTTLPLNSTFPVGGKLKFIVTIAPTTAYTIITNSADVNTMIGGINELEVDTTEDGPSTAGADLFTFVASSLTSVGDWVEFTNNGTNWYFTGQTVLDGAVTLA